jgi:trehalose 6-phosphate phosphatase
VLDVAATIDALVERPTETVVLADFDGSLSPIVDRPGDATPLTGALDALAGLVGRLARVGIVSGRPIDYLAEHVPVDGLVLAGLYGMEWMVDGVRRVDPRVTPYLDGVARAADEAESRLPGIIVERKSGVSVTLHWRIAPEREDEVLAVARELAGRNGLAELRTRYAIELRPPVAIDKGTAIDMFVEGCAVAAYAGDDTGDLAAFGALARAEADGRLTRAVRIGVRSPEMPDALPDAVDVLVNGPPALVDLLAGVVRALP